MLMIGKQLTAQQRLFKAVVDIMAQEYFTPITGVLTTVRHRIDSTGKTQTAYTNGIECVYGEEFVNGMPDAEFRFLILHEAFHCMWQHLTTWQWMHEEDPQCANEACDHVINLQILDAAEAIGNNFIVMPSCGGHADPQYRGMDAAEVYRALRKKKEGQQGGQGDQSQPQPGQPGQNDQGQPGQQQQQSGGFDEHGWDEAQAMSDEEKADIARRIDEAVRQGALLAGKTGSGGERLVAELLQAKIRWQDALREYLQEMCAGNEFSTWRRPNRRFVSAGIYMPSGVSEKLGEIVIAPDMSGSIGDREVKQFLGEAAAIFDGLKPSGVHMMYWDTRITAHEFYEEDRVPEIVKTTKPKGGGGTAPSCLTQYMAERGVKPKVVVVLTDGYVGSDWGGEWPCPVLWCIAGNKSAQPSVGKAVHIEWNE